MKIINQNGTKQAHEKKHLIRSNENENEHISCVRCEIIPYLPVNHSVWPN